MARPRGAVGVAMALALALSASPAAAERIDYVWSARISSGASGFRDGPLTDGGTLSGRLTLETEPAFLSETPEVETSIGFMGFSLDPMAPGFVGLEDQGNAFYRVSLGWGLAVGSASLEDRADGLTISVNFQTWTDPGPSWERSADSFFDYLQTYGLEGFSSARMTFYARDEAETRVGRCIYFSCQMIADITALELAPVPAPASAPLLGAAMAGGLIARRRLRRRGPR